MHRIFDSVRIEADVTACEQCGSTSRVGRGLCLNCLLLRCLGSDSENKSTLKRLLDEIDVRDADWRIGNYQILEEIGRGGMGVIYRARQRHSRRIVALKRMLSFQADSQETLARFRREAEAAASLDHPNILPIYEVSEGEDGLPFFSMKFAPGGSLLDAAPALRNEPRRSVELMAKVARAVAIRAQPRDSASRSQARKYFTRRSRRTAGERFRSGQVAGHNERRHAHADDFRDARVHRARASEKIGGQAYPGSRCLQSRRHLV